MAHGNLGKKRTPAQRLKMSIAGKGRTPWNKGKSGYKVKPASEDRKRKIGLANSGRKWTEDQKRKLSKALKGRKTWNYGLTKESNETVRKIAEGRLGENHPNWKGNEVKYRAIHCRIEAMLGKPMYCEICKSTDKKAYDWSNKDHRYSLKKEDWQRLCRSCHIKYDRTNL